MLGLVVLRTKAQNGFCPMCTKECYIVPTCSKHFWGQFWGQICKTNSDLHRSNKCAALVSLRNVDTNIIEFPRRKSPTNQYIGFTLQQEVVYTNRLHAVPTHRPCRREKRPCLGAFAVHRRGVHPVEIPPQNFLFPGIFYFTTKAFT